MTRHRSLAVPLLLASLVCAHPAAATLAGAAPASVAPASVAPASVAPSGPTTYLVGQLGLARADLSDLEAAVAATTGLTDIESREDSASYSLGIGLRVSEFVSFEARYMGLGKFNISSNSGGGKADIKLSGISLGVLGLYPLSRDTAVYVRADAISTHVDIEGRSDDQWQPGIGIGLEHFLNDGLKLRGEYQHVFLEDDTGLKVPLDSITIGLLQAF